MISFVFKLYGCAIDNFLLFFLLLGVGENYFTPYNASVLFLDVVIHAGVLGDFTFWLRTKTFTIRWKDISYKNFKTASILRGMYKYLGKLWIPY